MIEESTQPPEPTYPVRVEIEYQEELSRLATFFRLILMIPLVLFVAILSSGDFFRR